MQRFVRLSCGLRIVSLLAIGAAIVVGCLQQQPTILAGEDEAGATAQQAVSPIGESSIHAAANGDVASDWQQHTSELGGYTLAYPLERVNDY